MYEINKKKTLTAQVGTFSPPKLLKTMYHLYKNVRKGKVTQLQNLF